jgi:hypothetical protein
MNATTSAPDTIDYAAKYRAEAEVAVTAWLAGRPVVAIESESSKIMSDVWADIYMACALNPDGTLDRRCVGNSEFGCDFRPTVDSSPEGKAAYAAALEAEAAAREASRNARAAEARKYAEECEARVPRKGRKVIVVRGRKVAKGTTGIVMWYGDSKFGYRVGIATSDSRDSRGFYADVVWTAASNVEVVG